MAAKEELQVVRQAVHRLVSLSKQDLQGKDRRECLQLHQFWSKRAIGRSHETKIRGHEVRVRIIPGHSVRRRDRGQRGCHVGGIVQQLPGQGVPQGRQLFQQGLREEARRFRNTKVNRRSALDFKGATELGIGGVCVLLVKLLAPLGNHVGKYPRRPPKSGFQHHFEGDEAMIEDALRGYQY